MEALSHDSKVASHAYCTLCSTDVSIASGGVHEIRRHTEGKKYSYYAHAAASQAPITAA